MQVHAYENNGYRILLDVSSGSVHVVDGIVYEIVVYVNSLLKIEEEFAAITEKTKVIVPVHYAGVGCEMDTILDIAGRHGLTVVEDAAQGVMSTYKGKTLGNPEKCRYILSVVGD